MTLEQLKVDLNFFHPLHPWNKQSEHDIPKWVKIPGVNYNPSVSSVMIVVILICISIMTVGAIVGY